MQKNGFVALALVTTLGFGVTISAQQVQPRDLGVVEAPTAGSTDVSLGTVPLPVRHAARVAFHAYVGDATLTSAQLDQDDVLAVWEIGGETADGRKLEADVRADGVVVELEIEIRESDVPNRVSAALKRYAPNFSASHDRPQIEKSIRPSAVGMPEIWYEFSGTTFDVEVRSDGGALLIEPA